MSRKYFLHGKIDSELLKEVIPRIRQFSLIILSEIAPIAGEIVLIVSQL